MSSLRLYFEVKGIESRIEAFNKIGKSPQQALRKAATTAGNTLKSQVSSNIPAAPGSGVYQKSLVKKVERHRARGKGGVAILPSASKRAYVKLGRTAKNPGKYGGRPSTDAEGKARYYYPASLEYGWLTGDGNGGVKHIPGKHYMRNGAEMASESVKQVFIREFEKELDKAWEKTSLRG